jgi:hypothetical protein
VLKYGVVHHDDDADEDPQLEDEFPQRGRVGLARRGDELGRFSVMLRVRSYHSYSDGNAMIGTKHNPPCSAQYYLTLKIVRQPLPMLQLYLCAIRSISCRISLRQARYRTGSRFLVPHGRPVFIL